MLVSTAAAVASDQARVSAALVSAESYQHFIEDMLFTHDGDDRGFGPEHDLARDNIVTPMTSFGLTVSLEPVTWKGATFQNIVGTLDETTMPEREYLIGVHLDSASTPRGG